MIKSRPKLSVIHLGGEIVSLVLVVSFLFFLVISNIRKETDWILFSGFLMAWLLIGFWKKLYSQKQNRSIGLQLTNFFKGYILLIGLSSLLYFLYPELVPDKDLIVGFVLGFPVFGIPVNFLVIKIINQISSADDKKKYILVAGVGRLAANIEKEFMGHEIKGYIKCSGEECHVKKDQIVGELNSIHQFLRDNPVDEIVIAFPVKSAKKVRNILATADYFGVRVKYIPDYQHLFGEHYKTKRYGHIEAVHVRQLPLDETNSSLAKSAFDKIFSFVALLMLLPLFLVLAILIKLDSPGPVIYCPVRIGKGGKPFKVYKFRSMRENEDAARGILSTTLNDPRITKIGKFMRKYSLDELPQFINVFLGNMSVVGPRPHRCFLNQQLQESEDKYMIRHYYKPGITGWAQVNGWRGPLETKEQKSQRTSHDIWYMEHWSLALDLKIIFLTIFSRKVHKNAF
ncbi:exopolysaccharide biosynthesis polyprenyl glycosylphosphotransferase [Pontibacter beigongshangensis]|uniref:exopolysaccharide biosynthesis polyprenyl glycosylphosphotransferase n=1 Tax=Pontibacter beigongshangensis TaxID=2574733 RepID=UPI00164FED0F|nr:exopolysaccharide biosynthesis polyprenyl glycosylphosphotransferase [Pontibacter beigongshangensis]